MQTSRKKEREREIIKILTNIVDYIIIRTLRRQKMKFTYEALWKTLREKKLTFESIAQELKTSTLEFSPFISDELAPKALIDKLCDYLKCGIADIVDSVALNGVIITPNELSTEQDAVIMRGVRSKIQSMAQKEKRYEVLDYNPEMYDFALEGRFVLEDMDFFLDCVKSTISEVDASIPWKDVKVSIVRRELLESPLTPSEKGSQEAKELVEKLQKAKEAAAATSVKNIGFDIDADEKAAFMRARAEKESPTRLDTLREEIDGLVGAKEFRNLCNEIISIAPQFRTEESKKVFLSQSYLFSIGTGGGLTTALRLIGNVVKETGILPIAECKEHFIRYEAKPEMISVHLRKTYEDIFEENPLLPFTKGSNCELISLDISEWIDHIGNYHFREFLRKVAAHQENNIIVFRIPFVEKDVLLKVREALNDAMYVRMVSFPPFSAEDYHTLAKLELTKHGYKMVDAAWQYVDKRLTDEKSDGTFYGIKTLKKVINELLYRKAVSNASLKVPSLRITAKDSRALTEYSVEDQMSAEEMLSSLVGMDEVKNQLREILNQIEFSRGTKDLASPTIHMRFVGNPGTGKTTVARILGKMLKEKGILRIGNFFEYTGRDFCGRYVGETAPKTQLMCRDAYGSVLFIDEAYTLYRGDRDNKDYGKEALDTLISEMENHRDDLLVIMAGYPDDMEYLMQGNSGLRSRIPYLIHFRNFTREELYQIFESLVKKHFKYDDEILPAAKEYFLSLDESVISSKEFSNGRFVRNIFERTWAKAAMRRELENGKLRLAKEDFLLSIADQEFKDSLVGGRKSKRIGFGSSMN